MPCIRLWLAYRFSIYTIVHVRGNSKVIQLSAVDSSLLKSRNLLTLSPRNARLCISQASIRL